MRERDLATRWFNTMFYPKNRTSPAARYEDGVLPRLRRPAVTFFTPWGPRYSYEKRGTKVRVDDAEVRVLERLSAFADEWQQQMPMKEIRWVFLGADLYGTRVNNLPEVVVAEYFASVAEWVNAAIPCAEFRLWSSYDAEAAMYRERIRRDIDTYVSPWLLARAQETARKMRGGDPLEYLVERMAEAMLIEETLHPIKVSCVGKHKDTGVDLDLPCLYLLPQTLHAPWL